MGYSGLLGLGLPGLLAAERRRGAGRPAGRARSVIVILLSGGLGQHDSFDMKPEAPEAMRGEFKPIDTAVPGIRICEHLPGLAARAGKLAIVRSMSHPEGNHLLAVHRVLTGQPSNPRGASDLDRVASRDDFPCYAAVLDRFGGGATASPAVWPCQRGWSKARSPGRGRTPASSAPGTTPGSFGLIRISPRSATTAWPCRPGSIRDRLHRRRHLLGQTRRPAGRRSFRRSAGCRAGLAVQREGRPGAGRSTAKTLALSIGMANICSAGRC